MSKITPCIIELSEARTSPKFGCAPTKRSIIELIENGIIVIDKTKGPTSHEIVAWIKNIMEVEKAGHSGTLDPKVTGLLPVALKNGTKVLKNLLGTGKEYVCLMHIHDEVEKEKIVESIKLFEGVIYQRPPVKSAVKRQVRKREIYSIEILEMRKKDVLMRINCQAGTYIRKLVYDIGMVMGCGANMAELRRTRVGSFTERDVVTLQGLSDAYYFWREENEEKPLRKILFPIERAVYHLPRVWIRDTAIDAVCHGADVAMPGIVRLEESVQKNHNVAVFSLKEELVAIGTAIVDAKAIQKKKEGFVVKTRRVIMKDGTYPRHWKGSN
ncbi:MAG: RNA-guided pseudouridylation complex pseudouridine synthase subunit Cbf5 [Candidatus Methanofastidiosia archaeon]